MNRALILAAGTGSRLGARTAEHPKCLVELAGSSLLDWQLRSLRRAGVTEIAVVTGAHATQLAPHCLNEFHNEQFATTNMVASLMRARSLFDGTTDVIIAYGDIVYEPRLVTALIASTHEISVVVDRSWRDLWELRMDNPLSDAETLKIGVGQRLVEIGGKPASYADIEAQYIGLVKIAARHARTFVDFYDALDPIGPYEGRDRDNMFMTTLLQMCIDAGEDVGAVEVSRGWAEVDTNDDIAAYEALLAKKSFKSFVDFEAF